MWSADDKNHVTDDKNHVTDDKNRVTDDKNSVTNDKNCVTDDKNSVTNDKNHVTYMTRIVSHIAIASTPFATPLSQTLHFSIVLTFPMCFFKIYAVWNFLSQMLQLDSFFWWYSL